MTKKELFQAYWGLNGRPDQWTSVKAIAEKHELTQADVRKAMLIFNIPVRSISEATHSDVWQMLVDVFHYEAGVDFRYKTRLKDTPVDFLLVEEGVAICVDSKMPQFQISTLHMGNCWVITFPADRADLVQAIERELRKANVLPKHVADDEEDGDVW
jgi:hypothetical protein